MPRSMTGFARNEHQAQWGTIACEIRSVNHRYLEPGFKLPESLRAMETHFRSLIKNKLNRGKVETTVFLKFEHNDDKLALNVALAEQLVSLSKQVSSLAKDVIPLDPIDVLRWPGVLQTAEVDKAELERTCQKIFESALDSLLENREREGAELKTFIEQRLEGIATHVHKLRLRLPEILAANEQRLRDKLAALAVEVDEERLTQELVFVAQKADVDEELDRLEAHIHEVNLTLKQRKPIGRRLDFLMQELNREANTLSSKSLSSDTTQSAVDLKVLIEQMREQVQNLE